MTKLEIAAYGKHSTQDFSISKARTTVGRNPINDLVLESENVSGKHAEIVRTDDGGLSLSDLDSSNGTFVNGERIECCLINSGDEIRFGNIEVSLAETGETGPAAFGSMAISQAKQAMQKLQSELPGESNLLTETACEKDDPADSEIEEPPAGSVSKDPEERLQPESEPPREPEKTDDKALAKSAAEIEALKSKISELEKTEAGLVQANLKLNEELGEARLLADAKHKESQASKSLELERQERLASAEKAVSEKNETIAELQDRLQDEENKFAVQNEEIAQLQADLEAAGGAADDHATKLIEQAKSEAAKLKADFETAREVAEEGARKRIEQAESEVADLKVELEAARGAADERVTKRIEGAESEATKLRGELAALREKFAGVADARAELDGIRQEVASLESERARLQEERRKILAEAEAERAEAMKKQEEITLATTTAQSELEDLGRAINEAQQQEDVRIAKMETETREVERKRDLAADELNSLEERIIAAERQLNDITVATEALESQSAKFRNRIGKEEKSLKKIQAKIGRRKKLLARLKTVARRERAVEKKIADGKQFIEAAEAHANLPQVQPWDVDQARVERDQARKDARKIRREIEAMKAELEGRESEIEDNDPSSRFEWQADEVRDGLAS